MEWLDITIAVAYVAAFLKVQKKEYISCFIAMLFSMCFCWTIKDWFSVKNDGIECLYFLTLGAIWLAAAAKIKNNKVKIAVMVMSTYELLCGIESFIWQFVTPVTTPVIDYYIYNVVAIHVIILASIYKWGVKIEKPMERVFVNGKRYNISLYGNKIMARNTQETKR